MPTNRFSTRSTRPMALRPPTSLSSSTRVTASSFCPLTATGTPCSNAISTASACSGAACAERDLHLVLRDHGTREGRAEQVFVLVDRAGHDGGKDVLGEELLAHVLDHDLRRSGRVGLLDNGLDVVTLAHITDHGDHVVT